MFVSDEFDARLDYLLFNIFTVGCLSKQAALSSHVVRLQYIALVINQASMPYFPHSHCSCFRLGPFPAGYCEAICHLHSNIRLLCCTI